jgi:hypothetical protein
MAAIDLSTQFNEKGSGAIGFSFTGLNDEEVTPNTFNWKLTDDQGTVINSRTDVSETPATTTWILLQGLDLADTSTNSIRIVTIQGTYNSILGGIAKTNVEYTGEYRFDLRSMINIT